MVFNSGCSLNLTIWGPGIFPKLTQVIESYYPRRLLTHNMLELPGPSLTEHSSPIPLLQIRSWLCWCCIEPSLCLQAFRLKVPESRDSSGTEVARQLTAGAWLLCCLGLPILQRTIQFSLCLPIPPRTPSWQLSVWADNLGMWLKLDTALWGQLYNSFSGLVPTGIFMMVPLSTVSLGSIGHPYSTIIARGLSQDVSLLHLIHYSLDLTLHPS